MNVEKVKRLLIKHDYITKLNQTKYGCTITAPFPALIMKNDLPRLVEYISIQRGKESGFWFSSTHESKEKFISVPEYGLRAFLLYEAMACSLMFGIDPSLIAYYNEAGEEQEYLEQVIAAPESKTDANLEGFLSNLILEAVKDGFPEEYDEVAKTHNVYEGYELIKRFYL